MMRDYVSDTGPLISFERIPDGFSLLRRLAHTITIPNPVYEELRVGLPIGTDYLAHHGIADFVEVVQVVQMLPETEGLHEGERHAITLAATLNLPLLIEERPGHAIAEKCGLRPIGAIGLILNAWKSGMITKDETAEHFAALFSGKRISRAMLDKLLLIVKGN